MIEDKSAIDDIVDGIIEHSSPYQGARTVQIGNGSLTFELGISGFSELGGPPKETSVEFSSSFVDKVLGDPTQFTTLNPTTMAPIKKLSLMGLTTSDGNPEKLVFPSGVIVIYGKTGTGKSETLKVLSSALKSNYLRFHEPEIPSILNPQELIKGVSDFLASDKQSLAWDSARFFIFNVNGKRAAGKGGISAAFYSDITALSVLCNYLNKTIFVVVNPMVDDEATVNNIATALAGSAAGVITTRSYGSFNYSARTEESMRKTKTFHYVDDDGKPLICEGKDNTDLENDENSGDNVIVSEENKMKMPKNESAWFSKTWNELSTSFK